MSRGSEFGEDVWILEHLKDLLPEKGVYVDIGCGLPDFMSNTAFLRDRGWTGLAIDANPAYGEHWKHPGNPFICAVLSDKPVVKFEFRENTATSRICDTGQEVETVPLDQILEMEHIKKIDFLSIDIEGAEFDVMKEFDFAWWEPTIIVAEYNTAGLGFDLRMLNYLLKTWGYEAVHHTVANFIYVKR